MAFYICMAAAAAFTATVIIWKIRGKDSPGGGGLNVQTFLMLALADTCILYIPWFLHLWQTEEGNFRNKLVFFPFMIVRLMQTVSMDADYESALQIATLSSRTGVSSAFLQFYTVVLSYISVMVPLTGVLTVLSFFGNQIGGRIAMSRLSPRKKVYIFNGTGERNLELAHSIWTQNGGKPAGCTFLFCNVREDPGLEVARLVRKIGGFYTPDYPSRLLTIARPGNGKELFYFLFEDEGRNFNDVINILKTAGALRKDRDEWECADRVRVTTVLKSDELSSILDVQERYGIFVRVIDIDQLRAQDLFSRWPLFSCLSGDKTGMNIMIIGNGSVAEEVLLSAIWMGQIAGASLRIRFISESANALRNKLFMTCPALFDPELAGGQRYYIDFENIEGDDDLSLQSRSFDNADYIVVASENDSYNMQAAMWLRTWAARDRAVDAEQPFIAVYIKDGKRADQAEQLCVQDSSDISYDFHVFGTDTWMFNADHILNSSIVRVAHRVQMSYDIENREGNMTDILSQKAWAELNQSVYNFRSSEACALYLANRLYDSGALLECMRVRASSPDRDYTGMEQAAFWKDAIKERRSEGSDELIGEIVALYEEKIRDPEILEKLSASEHRRWIAYMACSGWVKMPADQLTEWMEMSGGKHKDYLRLRHAFMTDWSSSEDVSLIKTRGKNPYMVKELDRQMVKNLRFLIG